MASSLLEVLTEASNVVDTDITYLVQDPAGTPRDTKLTVAALRDALMTGATPFMYATLRFWS
jgi:hypothetical protein